MLYFVLFIGGIIVGASCGIMCTCLCVAAKVRDEIVKEVKENDE